MEVANVNMEEKEITEIVISAVNKAMGAFVDKIENKLDRIQTEHRIDFEQLRRDVATGFYSRDVLDPQLNALRKDMERLERDKDKEILSLRGEIAQHKEREITQAERTWTRFGTIGGLIAVALSALSFFLSHPIH